MWGLRVPSDLPEQSEKRNVAKTEANGIVAVLARLVLLLGWMVRGLLRLIVVLAWR